MIKYHQNHIDFASLHENNIDRVQLDMIPAGSHVLEIGCATGYMTEYLVRDKQCRVLGVEPVQEQAEAARQRGLEVITGLIDSSGTLDHLIAHTEKHGLFEVIFMSQVIEHIGDPAATLRTLKNLLTPEGYLVISTCSIVHWKCRLKILAGRWEYEDYGIFDRTPSSLFHHQEFSSPPGRKWLYRGGF